MILRSRHRKRQPSPPFVHPEILVIEDQEDKSQNSSDDDPEPLVSRAKVFTKKRTHSVLEDEKTEDDPPTPVSETKSCLEATEALSLEDDILEPVTVNGVSVPDRKQLCQFSPYFASLMLGQFAEKNQNQFHFPLAEIMLGRGSNKNPAIYETLPVGDTAETVTNVRCGYSPLFEIPKTLPFCMQPPPSVSDEDQQAAVRYFMTKMQKPYGNYQVTGTEKWDLWGNLVQYWCATDDYPDWFYNDIDQACRYYPILYSFTYLQQLWSVLHKMNKADWFSQVLVLPSETEWTRDFWWHAVNAVKDDMWKYCLENADLVIAWSHHYCQLADPRIADVVLFKTCPSHTLFWYNLRQMTDGLLPLTNWPEGVILAGGAVVEACFGTADLQRSGRDVDLWIWDDTFAEPIIREMLSEWAQKKPDLIVWKKHKSVDILFPGCNFHIQILIRHLPTPWSVVTTFDFDYVRGFVGGSDNIMLYLLPECLMAWETRQVRWIYPEARTCQERLEKARLKGFDVTTWKMAEKVPEHDKFQNLPWIHPRKEDPLWYIKSLAQCVAPMSEVMTWSTFQTEFDMSKYHTCLVDEERYEKVVDIDEKMLQEVLSKNCNTSDPGLFFRIYAEFRIDKRRPNQIILMLEPKRFPAQMQFIEQIQRLEQKGFEKWGKKFHRRFEEYSGQKWSMTLWADQHPLVYDEDNVLFESRAEQQTFLNSLDSVQNKFAEILVSSPGIWKLTGQRSSRTVSMGIAYRYHELRVYDSAQVAEMKVGPKLQQVQITYFNQQKPVSQNVTIN